MAERRFMTGLCIVLLCCALCGCCTRTGGAASRLPPIWLPYEWFGNIEKTGFNEPSGIVFVPSRGSLFLVGDEGDICEMTTEGELLRQAALRPGADLEGITLVPESGLLYVAVEGEEKILEVEPESFAILREFTIPRSAGGEELFKAGGSGIEAICFVADASHPQGGTFFVANQSFSLEPGDERSLIVELELPLRTRAEGGQARIRRWFEPGIIDISALHYEAATGHLLAISDAQNVLIRMTTDGRVLRTWALTGANQEGLTMDEGGLMYIAQDSGGVIKIRPLWQDGRP